jgi:hypothetical protein
VSLIFSFGEQKMLRFTTFMALASLLLFTNEGYAQRWGRGRTYNTAPQAAPRYYGAPATTFVQPTVRQATVAAQAPAGVPCDDQPVQVVPTPGAPPPGIERAPDRQPQPAPRNAAPDGDKPFYRCDDCDNPDCKGEGKCEIYNPPKITRSGGPGCEGQPRCEVRKNPAVGHLPTLPGVKTDFYKRCIGFKAQVDVPHIVKDSREFLEFGRQKYSVDCCEFEVCVVTCCCTVDKDHCKLAPYNADLRACIRYDNIVDIYVEGVPGMPERWVLAQGLSLDEAKAKFGQALPAGLTNP